jgi:hypothetical protein
MIVKLAWCTNLEIIGHKLQWVQYTTQEKMSCAILDQSNLVWKCWWLEIFWFTFPILAYLVCMIKQGNTCAIQSQNLDFLIHKRALHLIDLRYVRSWGVFLGSTLVSVNYAFHAEMSTISEKHRNISHWWVGWAKKKCSKQ